MNEQEQNASLLDVRDEFGKNSMSPTISNTAYHSRNKMINTPLLLENCDLNRDLDDPVKYFDLQRMINDQKNELIAVKILEYDNALAERDYNIKSLQTNMKNSQNNNYILTNQCKQIMEKTKSVNDTCIRLRTNFTNICDRLNRLSDTIDNARTRQKEVMTLVDKTTSTFQEKFLSISDSIDESLKQVNIEKLRTKQDLEILKNNYSLEVVTCQTNLQECNYEIENLKKENNFLLEKLNHANLKLNEEKETVLRLNQHFETQLKEMEGQNLHFVNQNKTMNENYKLISTENQTLRDEIDVLKAALNENKNQLDIQSNIIKKQTELCNNLKILEESNDLLKKDNFTLKEQNKYLEQINTDLMDDITNTKLAQSEILEDKENKIKNMCGNYDKMLELQEQKIHDITEKLASQNDKEMENQTEVVTLRQEIEVSNKTITDLQEELQANLILIPELQNKINDLNTNFSNIHQKLRDSNKDLVTKNNELEKEKIELENQSKEHFLQIEKLTANYMKYKSKAKQLYAEVMRLKFQFSQSERKQKIQPPPTLNTIEILSDEDNDDCSIVEFNDVSNVADVSIHSTSNKPLQKSNYSNLKRNSSPLLHIGDSKAKKHKTAVDVTALQLTTIPSNILKPKNDARQFERSLNFSFKNISSSHGENNENKTKLIEEKNENNQNVSDNIDYNSIASVQQMKSSVNNERNKSKFTSTSNTDPKPATKKTFKIPADMKSSQQKLNQQIKKINDWTKPNSPVLITAPSPKRQTKFNK